MKWVRSNARRIVVAVLLVLIVAGVFLLWPARTPIAEPVPSPNGYDDFLKAAALLSPTRFGLGDLAEDELRKMVTHNAPALNLLRSALDLECRVPVEYSADYMSKHALEMSGHKGLALALAAEGSVAELDRRTNNAARCYLDAIRLGHEAARGGILIDHLSGLACEGLGAWKLTKIVKSLDAKECRSAIATLEQMEDKRESPDETLRIERTWSRRQGVQNRIRDMIYFKSLNPVKMNHKQFLVRLQGEIARQAQLRIDLAKRAYELEHGKPPASLDVLVPTYLKALPDSQIVATNAPSAPPLKR